MRSFYLHFLAFSAPIFFCEHRLYVNEAIELAETSDKQLVEAALHGNVDSFTHLCSKYYPAIVAIAHAISGDRHLAEDAAQEASIRALEKLDELKKPEKFAYWFSAICRSCIKDMLRERKNVSPIQNENCEHDDEKILLMRKVITSLPASLNEIVFMKYYDDLSYEQISKALGISVQAINGRLRRAKQKIKSQLKKAGFTGN
jgi:RNA polymerase sigma-70 factor, ECF subfamily